MVRWMTKALHIQLAYAGRLLAYLLDVVQEHELHAVFLRPVFSRGKRRLNVVVVQCSYDGVNDWGRYWIVPSGNGSC